MFLLSETRLPEEDADEEFELPRVLTVAELAQVWHTVIDMQVKTPQGKGDSKPVLQDRARVPTILPKACGPSGAAGASEQRRGELLQR